MTKEFVQEIVGSPRLSLAECERLTDGEIEARVIKPKESSPPHHMKFSLSSAPFMGASPERVMKIAAELGFDGVEALLTHNFLKKGPNDLKKIAEEYGIEILSFHAPYFAGHTKLDTFTNPKDKRLIQKRDVRIGLPLLFLMPNLLQGRRRIDEKVRAFQKPLVVHAEQVYLADRILENRDGLFDWLRELNEDGLLLVEDAELSFVAEPWAHDLEPERFAQSYPEFSRRTFDIGYFVSYFQSNPFRWLERTDLEIGNIHLCDALTEKYKTHLPLGEGELPLRQFLHGLHQIGYSGLLTLEIASHKPTSPYLGAIPLWPTQKMAERIMRPILKESLTLARKYTCSEL